MTESAKEQTVEKQGIDVDSVTFDADGKPQGLEESQLDGIAGGAIAQDLEDGTNNGCINAYSC